MSYVVLFASKLVEADEQYHTLKDALHQALVKQQGYCHKSYRDEKGLGCTISNWEKLESLKQWKEFPLHLKSQEKRKQKWYEFYQVKICKIEKEYE